MFLQNTILEGSLFNNVNLMFMSTHLQNNNTIQLMPIYEYIGKRIMITFSCSLVEYGKCYWFIRGNGLSYLALG